MKLQSILTGIHIATDIAGEILICLQMDIFLVLNDVLNIIKMFATHIADVRQGFVFSLLVHLQLVACFEFPRAMNTREESLTGVIDSQMAVSGLSCLLLTALL